MLAVLAVSHIVGDHKSVMYEQVIYKYEVELDKISLIYQIDF